MKLWISSAPTIPIKVKADHKVLADFRSVMGRSRPFEGTIAFLRKYCPQVLDSIEPDEKSFVERGAFNYGSAATHGGDEFFMQRVCLMTVSDLTMGAIQFTFPEIENKVSPKS